MAFIWALKMKSSAIYVEWIPGALSTKVSWNHSKIPYGLISRIRLQAGCMAVAAHLPIVPQLTCPCHLGTIRLNAA